MEYHIWCDESVKKGEFFSNFYGGVLVKSMHLDEVNRRLIKKRHELNLDKELKWTKVTKNYLDKYKQFVSEYFQLMREGKLKVRIFFTHNLKLSVNLKREHKEQEFFILYYQFFKHAFGLQYADDPEEKHLRVYFDYLPDRKEKGDHFKKFIEDLSEWREYRNNNVFLNARHITEVDSKDYTVLQGLDIVLGCMSFKLNKKDQEYVKISQAGRKIKGKKTKAKIALYKHIYTEIRTIHTEYFNIGLSTSIGEDLNNRWLYPYSHWKFESYSSEVNEEYSNKKMP